MMLSLVGVLLSCTALCLASPVPSTTGTVCVPSSLIQETLSQTLQSKGSIEIAPSNNIIEPEGNITTYLERFIEVLKSSKENSKKRLIVRHLQKIHAAAKSCLQWMEQDWEPVEEYDFFSNLEYLLRFLNHNAFPEETA